jgi:release factor glutamine methyltransferase
MIWTPPKLVKWISNDFEEKGFPPPHRFQAEMLVSHALGISRLDIYLQHDKPCTSLEQQKLREMVKRRYRREPVAYIVGSCEFWTLSLKVGPGVLIPRADTEVLVEVVLEKMPENTKSAEYSILEMGTGSAAIPLALCSERSNLSIVTTDCSAEALSYAGQNLAAYQDLLSPKNNRIMMVQTDRFSAVKQSPYFDFIISNPPYIPENQFQSLQKEVSEWEPGIALAAGKYGTDFYEYFMNAGLFHLKPEGLLILEHGFDQAELIQELFCRNKKFKFLENRKDYSKHNRVLVFEKIE